MRIRILPTTRATGVVHLVVGISRFTLPIDETIDVEPAAAEALEQAQIGFEVVPAAEPEAAESPPPEGEPVPAAEPEAERRTRRRRDE